VRPEALHSSESAEWYSPDEVVALGRQTMGAIDLDPASCTEANEWIGARRIYTIADNGLERIWAGRVWLNPPYGRGEGHESNQGIWTRKLIAEYRAGHVTQAVLLVNAVPDRVWFHDLWAYPISFGYKRIRFIPPGGFKAKSPTHPSVLVYFGPRVETFASVTREWGHLCRPERVEIVRTPVLAA
jgi:hypothetical protein